MQVRAIDGASGVGVEFEIPDDHELAVDIAAYALSLNVTGA